MFSQIAPLCQFTSPPVLGNLSNNVITGSWDAAVSSNTSGNQVYTFTPSASQCATTVTMTIQVNSLPVINAGQDQVVCDGEQVMLTASGASVYNWNNSVVNNVPFLPSLGSMTYTVTGTDLNGCTSTDNLIISVNPIPSVSAGDDVIICEGQQVILSASGASTYTWSDNILNGVVFTPNSGVYSYTVTGTNSFGCTSVDNLQLTVNDTPTALFQLNGLGCVPYTVELESISSGGNCFWELSNGETLSGCSVVTTLSNPGCYDVSLTVENNGCSASFTQNNALCAEDLPVAEFVWRGESGSP